MKSTLNHVGERSLDALIRPSERSLLLSGQIRCKMNSVIHRAASRGHADRGRLKTSHTFSFAEYADPQRVRFGALRVLNDERLAPGGGFGPHPVADMEWVTLPLKGVLLHEDDRGNRQEIVPGEIQVMTAGSGLVHTETNVGEQDAEFLQIGILTDSARYTPRYEQVELAPARPDAVRVVVAPEGFGGEHVGWIHQEAWLSTVDLEAGRAFEYRLHVHSHGVYVFVVEGTAEVAGEELAARDGMGVWEADEFLVKGTTAARLLLVEVPM